MRRRLAIWLLRGELHARRESAHAYSQAEWRSSSAGNKRGRTWWNGYERALEALESGTGL
jgi:hypothetical protein